MQRRYILLLLTLHQKADIIAVLLRIFFIY